MKTTDRTDLIIELHSLANGFGFERECVERITHFVGRLVKGWIEDTNCNLLFYKMK